jgi:hypothetical protein
MTFLQGLGKKSDSHAFPPNTRRLPSKRVTVTDFHTAARRGPFEGGQQ